MILTVLYKIYPVPSSHQSTA